MGILSRYIVREIFKLLFPIWGALAFVLFIGEWLAKVFSMQAPIKTVFLLYLFKFPSFLQLVFPIAVLFSALAVLNNMNRNREIVALQSVGYRSRLVWLSLCLAILLPSIPYLWITTTLAPKGLRKHFELYDQEILHLPSRFSQVRQEKMWFRNQDVLYNVRYFVPEKNELLDVTIYTFDDDFQIAQTIYANQALWNGTHWVLSDGAVSLTDRRLDSPVMQKFKTRSTTLMEDPRSLKRFDFNAETMTQSELGRAIKRQRELGINTLQWEVAHASRYSFFLISFIFLLLAYPRAMRFRRSSSKGSDGVFIAAVCLIYWLLFNLAIRMGETGKIPPLVAAWAPSFLFLVGVYFYNQSRSLKTESE